MVELWAGELRLYCVILPSLTDLHQNSESGLWVCRIRFTIGNRTLLT